MVIDRECRCPAFPWPHEFGVSDCGDRMARLVREAETPEAVRDQYADDDRYNDPRTGQAAGLNAMRRIP